MLRSRRLPLALLLVGVLAVVWCLTDRYRVRAALFTVGRLTSRAEVDWSPAERPAWHHVDSPEALVSYAPMARAIAGEGTTRERALRLLDYVSELGGDHRQDVTKAPLARTDDVGEIMEMVRSRNYRGNCAHFSSIFHTLASAAGIDTRSAGLSADHWIDGVGHAVDEVYLPETGSWMTVDPLYHATFTDAQSRPLSLLELRDRLLSGRADEIRVIQGAIRTGKAGPKELLDIYALHIPRIMYVGNDDLLGARRRIYDGWLARVLDLSHWPRPLRRALENAVWGLDRRYLYVDRPELDDALVPHTVFRAALLLMAFAVAWLVAGWIARRRADERPQGAG